MQAALRKISTFELIDGDIFKEKVWQYEKEEEIDHYLQAAGIDSALFMFTFGLPLYILGYFFTLALALTGFNCKCNCKKPQILGDPLLEGG